MNRPFNLEIERELLRAAEENPGQALVLGSDGIARPAQAGLIQPEAAGPVAGESQGVDWAVVGPRLAEALLGALPVVEDALGDALRAVRLAEGLGGDGAEVRVSRAFETQAAEIRALLAQAGVTLPAMPLPAKVAKFRDKVRKAGGFAQMLINELP